MFAALLYSCEVWGNISHIAESLLAIERKALKACLGVKQGTANNLGAIYMERAGPVHRGVPLTRDENGIAKLNVYMETR